MKDLANLKQQVDKDFLREWGLKVAEEIEHLTHLGVASMKDGSLEDALEEAQIVLDMLDEKDLARRALELSAKLAEFRLSVRGTRLVTGSVESVRMEVARLAQEIKERLSPQVQVGAQNL